MIQWFAVRWVISIMLRMAPGGHVLALHRSVAMLAGALLLLEYQPTTAHSCSSAVVRLASVESLSSCYFILTIWPVLFLRRLAALPA
jgi:hypothetical protein